MMAGIEKGYFPDKATQLAIKNTVDIIKTTIDTTKTGVDSLNVKQDTVLQKIQNGDLKRNIDLFNTPGTYTWTCPEGVEVINLTMFAGGGSGGIATNESSMVGIGGGGGAYVDDKPVKVVPGTTYSLVVGAGGAGAAHTNGTDSINGNTGGPSSAFGIICNGGARGTFGSSVVISAIRATGNSPLCNRGTTHSLIQDTGSVQNYSAVISSNRFGTGGIFSTLATGGGAGFASGGDSRNHTAPVGVGAGSGANRRHAAVDPPVYTAKGGDGIIIIEY